jgi:quinone-modifying oxidoreductase subunit QmoC
VAPERIEPDLKFVNEVIDSGGDSLKKCFQCATCSVACKLAPDKHPFPRKEMIWAQWGLKNKLIANPDIWLCHQCNDCSIKCPRGARPGDVLAAVRRQGVIEYSTPKFLARWLNSYQFLPILFIIPIFLLSISLIIKTPLGEALHPAFIAFNTLLGLEEHAKHGMHYSNLFPHWLLIGFFTFFTLASFLLGVVGVIKFWKDMSAADTRAGNMGNTNGIIPSIFKTVSAIGTHSKFSGCAETKSRFISHLSIFYGFIGLLIVTLWAILVLYVFQGPYPLDFFHPMKLFANISGIGIIYGCSVIIFKRMKDTDETGRSTYFDWAFVWIILIVSITGFITQFLRLTEMEIVGYSIYFIHLVFVFFLLVYLPYSKFAHILYRTTAMVYAEYTGRNNDQT